MEDIDASLREELSGKLRPGHTSERLSELEAALRPMYDALPKNGAGRISHATVRYAMHRLLSERHGWFVRGLEPDGSTKHSLKDWVPSYLQEAMERRSGEHGFDLGELAIFAATIEDLVHQESLGRVEKLYGVTQSSREGRLGLSESEEIVDLFTMLYLRGGALEAENPVEASAMLAKFRIRYAGWKEVSTWAREVWRNVSQVPGKLEGLDFSMAVRVTEAIGTLFGSFNDRECNDLKSTLTAIEDKRPGRVLLSTFYKMGLHTHWQFTEKIEYLRALGVLDESVEGQPAVLLPNYLASRPNCLEASTFYAVCCRNECEDLLSQIEREVKAPTSTAEELIRLVAKVSSPSVASPRQLSATLLDRLNQVAAKNGGRVPLHGRLFAQWIHHAFPRECPFPHEAGMANPQTPDEWMEATGQKSTTATEEEMVCFTNGECGKILATHVEGSASPPVSAVDSLPWSDEEVLLVGRPAKPIQNSVSRPWSTFIRALRLVVLSSAAFVLTYFATLSLAPRDDPNAKLTRQVNRGAYLTLALLLFPLIVLSIDYLFDYEANELFICGLCWGLASLLLWSFSQRSFGKYSPPHVESVFSGSV
jgi:hypothetical protein